MDTIENKELRGVNAKNIWGFVLIIVFIVGQYFLVIGKIEKIQIWQENFQERTSSQKQSDEKFNDLRIRTVELNLSALKMQLEDLRNQVDNNSNRINKK